MTTTRRMDEHELKTVSRSNRAESRAQKLLNMAYLREHYEELVEKYPNQWVTISGGRVVHRESDPNRLTDSAGKTRKRNGVRYYLAYPRKVMLL